MAYTNVNDKAPLLTSSEVVTYAFNTSANFDTSMITNHILKMTEIAHIEKILGREFYEELVTQHAGGSLTTANASLLDDFLYRALAWFTKYELMSDIQNNTTSSGIVTNIDEFSDAVSEDAFNRMKNETYRRANIFLDDMIEFLNDSNNSSSYPLWQKYGTRDNSMEGESTKRGGLIFYD